MLSILWNVFCGISLSFLIMYLFLNIRYAGIPNGGINRTVSKNISLLLFVNSFFMILKMQ